MLAIWSFWLAGWGAPRPATGTAGLRPAVAATITVHPIGATVTVRARTGGMVSLR